MLMVWLRKAIVGLLSLILFFAILDGIVSASLDMAFSHPDKLETWLNESGIYQNFISTALTDASNSMNSGNQNNSGISLSDPAVQQIAKTVFSPSLVQQYVTTLIDSNYSWLEGKTPTPEFSINVSTVKTQFAQQVGQYVTAHLNTLPQCTPSQSLATAEANDPLQFTCKPIGISSTQIGVQITNQLQNNSGFFNTAVITQNSINPNGTTNSQPYYLKFKEAPKIYQAATKVPWILAGISLLCILGIFFASSVKRKSIRKFMFIFFEVGIILVDIKVITNILFKKFENQLFNQASVGPLQKSLTTFTEKVETQLNNINFRFGLGLIAIGIAVAIYLIITHKRNKESAALAQAKVLTPPSGNQESTSSSDKKNGANKIQANAIPPISPTSKPSQPKKPRLIQ